MNKEPAGHREVEALEAGDILSEKCICFFCISGAAQAGYCKKNIYNYLTKVVANMASIQDQILDRIQGRGRGKVCTPKDFLDLGSRAAADQALHRLVNNGTLRRIGRGLYYYPRTNDRLRIDLPPDLDDIADALGRQTGSRVAPSGALAANRLGLSDQVPANPVYLSNGRTRKVPVGRYVIQLKHAPPKKLPLGSRTSALVFQALDFLGRDAVDDQVIKTLKKRLSRSQRRDVLRDARYAPAWLADIARKLAADTEVATHG